MENELKEILAIAQKYTNPTIVFGDVKYKEYFVKGKYGDTEVVNPQPANMTNIIDGMITAFGRIEELLNDKRCN